MFFKSYSKYALSFGIIVTAFFGAYWVTAMVVTPLQSALFGNTEVWRSIVYLPHGVCVLATMLIGWRAILPLTLSSGGGLYLFSADHLAASGPFFGVLVAFMTAACAFIAFEVFRYFGRNYYANPSFNVHWRSVFAVGILAAMIGAVGKSILYGATQSWSGSFHHYLGAVSGSICGLFALMFVVMLLFRWMRINSENSA